MKRVTYILILFSIVSCQQNADNKTEQVSLSDSVIVDMNSIEPIDSFNEILNSMTDSFLIKPFNLYGFKSKKNASLVGGAYFKNYHYKPVYSGIGYRFFMFEPKKVNYITDGKEMRHSKVGYIGTNKKMTSFREDGLVIKTFQPNDEYQNNYLNPNEVLIELIAKHNDFDLPEMAFVGLDSITIKKQLGQETFYKNNCLVYTNENIALILKLNNGIVEWIRYILLTEKLEFETRNSDLYKIE